MSNVTYEELLREAMVDLSEMQQQDSKCIEHKITLNKMADYKYFTEHWAAMYVRYIQIARKLEVCHDQVLQPQKRQEVRIMLDACIGRILEMKAKIIEFCGEYVSLDEALIDLKLTPDALEIPIPRYFVEEREVELNARQKLISDLCRTNQIDGDPSAAAAAANQAGPATEPMSLERAIEVLQCNERGRQGRQRVKFLKAIYEQEQHNQREYEYGNTMSKDDAAREIQKTIQGFLARKQAKTLWKKEYEFLGMEASEEIKSNAQEDKLGKTAAGRKMKQASNAAELGQETKDMRARIKVQEGGKIMEEMLDEVLNHLAQVRLAKGEMLPEFPTEEEGGSLALLNQPLLTAAEEEAKKKAEEEAAKKPQPKPEPKKTDKELEEEALPKLQPSVFWDRFEQVKDRYVAIWNPNFQKSYFEDKDFDQRFDKVLLRKEILEGPGGTLAELRKCVDQLVMVELANLKERMEREKGGKRKKGGKKGGKKAPKKPKNVKDPLEGLKIEQHMHFLVAYGGLNVTPQVRLKDYIGAPDLMGSVMDDYEAQQAEQADEVKAKWQALLNNWNEYAEKALNMNKDQFQVLFNNYMSQSDWRFEPSMQQVRQAITEHCILPLGSQVVHDLAPHPNAVLLYGHAKSGKTMLTHAIARETGSNFFNLSPHVLTREGQDLKKILQVVFRVAKVLAPSIIYIDEVEKVFPGKGKKKKGKKDPIAARCAKIKKDLIKELKDIQPSDRVLLVGNSRCPWEGDFKDLTNQFKAMVCCVHPDYGSRLALWQQKITAKGASLPKDTDYETLAYMTNKYTSGVISKVIDDTLTERRIKRLSQRPLKADEFLPHLARAQPIYKEEYDTMKEWVGKLPMNLRRAKLDDLKQEEEVDPKGKPKPKPKPKPKK